MFELAERECKFLAQISGLQNMGVRADVGITLALTIARYWVARRAWAIGDRKDFERIARVDFSPGCSGVLIRLGIQPQYCLPGHPSAEAN